MATKIVTKNSSTASAVPTASDLVQGELAVNVADKRLFTEDNAGAIVELGTNPTTLTVTGEITANGGIALGDNDKATFGASDDLQIYHTGSYSAIADVGTGAFYIGGADFVDIGNSTLSETSARFHVNDRVDLYHNNAVKLATTATGIDVTGTATMDGLVTQATANSYTAGAAQIKSLAGDISYITNVGGAFLISNSSTTDQFTLSSAGNVGIGTSSPSRALDLRPNATDDWQFRLGSNANALDTYDIGRDVGDGLLYFKGNQTGYTGYVFDSVDGERMRIDSSGNVAIGQQSTTGGSVKLDLHNSGSSVGTQIAFYNDHNTGGHFIGQAGNTTGNIIYYNVANTNQEFYNNNSLKMTLDASGNLLLGGTNTNPTGANVAGIALDASGEINASVAGGDAVRFNRKSDHGDIVRIMKDGITHGVLGTSSGTNRIFDINASTDGASEMRFLTHSGSANVEAMRIDSSGNVGIGISSPTQKLSLYAGVGYNADSALFSDFAVNDSAVNNNAVHAWRTGITGNAAGHSLTFSTLARTQSAYQERMRIDSSGNLLVGKTITDLGTAGHTFGNDGYLYHSRSGDIMFLNRLNSHGTVITFLKDGATVGTISTNANSLPSDRNFKRNIKDLTLGLDFVESLNPVTYNFKIDDEGQAVMTGLIAQEVEESLTAAGVEKNSMTLLQHSPTEDVNESDYQMDYLKFVPILINSIKEQQTLIESLTARIAALEE